MISLERLRVCETTFCADFAHCERRLYGLLFHNADNPLSHDSNHAVITDPAADASAALPDLEHFYLARGLQPRLYSALLPGELTRLRPALQARGYRLIENHWRWFVWMGEGSVSSAAERRLAVRRESTLTPDLVQLLHCDGPAPWSEGVLHRHLRVNSLHLLVGRAGGHAVAMASLKVMEGLSRVDDVLTDPAHRGHGYAREVMRSLVDYHRRISNNILYLYADNPTAIRVYHDVGFAECFPAAASGDDVQVRGWMAYLPDQPPAGPLAGDAQWAGGAT